MTRECAPFDIDEENTELFISLIKHHPFIWNVADNNFNNRERKKEAWMDICGLMYKGFDNKSEHEKNKICIASMTKWKDLKNNYIRSLNKEKAGLLGKKLIYAQHLSFLNSQALSNHNNDIGHSRQNLIRLEEREQPAVHNQHSVNKHNHNIEISSIETQSNCDNSKVEESPQRNPIHLEQPIKKNSVKKPEYNIETALINFMNTPIPTLTTVPNTDSLRLFFESILPHLSDLTEIQQLDFKQEVLNIVRRMAKTQHPTMHQSEHPSSSQLQNDQTFENKLSEQSSVPTIVSHSNLFSSSHSYDDDDTN